MTGRKKSLRLDSRFIVRAANGREGDEATFALGTRPGAVDDDAEDPGLEGRAPLEAIQPAQHTEPRLLDDLLGHLAPADVGACHPQHARMVAIEQLNEGGFIATAQ